MVKPPKSAISDMSSLAYLYSIDGCSVPCGISPRSARMFSIPRARRSVSRDIISLWVDDIQLRCASGVTPSASRREAISAV